jgi:cytochrome c-type biogenesis protein CcmE
VRERRFAVFALAVVALAFVVIAGSGIDSNLVYYWGPTELRAAGARAVGASIRLGGQVAPQSIARGSDGSSLTFDVADGKNTVRVRSTGVPPQMFREGIGVVVEGTLTAAGHFESRRLMVSHGNEYRPPGERSTADTRQLMRTTTGLSEEAR